MRLDAATIERVVRALTATASRPDELRRKRLERQRRDLALDHAAGRIGDAQYIAEVTALRSADAETQGAEKLRAIDDMSRVAYVGPFGDERGTTCARFLLDAAAFFASHGVRIERVLTDNAKNYTRSHAFAAALSEIGARHKRTRPFRPQTNGKAERFNGTLLSEWAYVRRYDTNQARLDALPGFLDHYNQRRPHGSLDGQSPMTVLVNNASGNHT